MLCLWHSLTLPTFSCLVLALSCRSVHEPWTGKRSPRRLKLLYMQIYFCSVLPRWDMRMLCLKSYLWCMALQRCMTLTAPTTLFALQNSTYLQKFMKFCFCSLYFRGCLPPFSGPVIWEWFFSRQLEMPLRGGRISVCNMIIVNSLFTVLSASGFFPWEHLSSNCCIVELRLKGFHGQCWLFHSHFASRIIT